MYSTDFSIYVHFPYCAQRCPYCDFNVHINKNIPQQEFIQSVLKEAFSKKSSDLWKERKINSIFFGGGTPSLFKPELIKLLILELKNLWICHPQIEISLEANPEDIDLDYAKDIRQAGVNRISLGVQSLQDLFLQKLGRIHSASKAKQAFLNLRRAGFENINIDLMFALPDQSLKDLETDLELAISLQPDHISYYNLTIERSTNFYQRNLENKLKLANDNEAAEMMQLIISSLNKAGYEHYEISNYAKKDKKCLHNLGYWKLKDYLGLGPGAHSAFQQLDLKQITHCANISDPNVYISKPENCTAWKETAKDSVFILEKLMLGLRLLEGFDLNTILSEVPQIKQSQLIEQIRIFEAEGFLSFEDFQIKLSNQGLLILDSLLEKISEILN